MKQKNGISVFRQIDRWNFRKCWNALFSSDCRRNFSVATQSYKLPYCYPRSRKVLASALLQLEAHWCIVSSGKCTVNLLCQEHGTSWETLYSQRLACSIDTGWSQTNVEIPFHSTCAFHVALLDSTIFCNWQWPYLPSVVLRVAVCNRTWGKQTHRLEVYFCQHHIANQINGGIPLLLEKIGVAILRYWAWPAREAISVSDMSISRAPCIRERYGIKNLVFDGGAMMAILFSQSLWFVNIGLGETHGPTKNPFWWSPAIFPVYPRHSRLRWGALPSTVQRYNSSTWFETAQWATWS